MILPEGNTKTGEKGKTLENVQRYVKWIHPETSCNVL